MSLRHLVNSALAQFDILLNRVFDKPGPELIVFRDYRAAHCCGFISGQQHPVHKHIMAWWPNLGEMGLLCRSVQRVTVPSDMLDSKVGGVSLWRRLRHRQQPWGKKAMWVEL